MIRDDEQFLAIADLFGAAALGGDWPTALNALADACGAESGELIGVGSDTAVPFNWMTRVDSACMDEFLVVGGGDPALNPRVKVGIRAPVMSAWHEAACSTEEELRRNFPYADLCRRYGIPHGSQTTLLREGGMLIGLATLRGQARGLPPPQDRRAFEAIAPYVRSAVLTQMTLEQQGAALIAGALDRMRLAAFVCDGIGVVRALTGPAETALTSGALRLKNGRLVALRFEDSRALEDAIASAATGFSIAAPPFQTVTVRYGPSPWEVQVVDVVTLPRRGYAFGFEPRVLVSVRGMADRKHDAPGVLAQAFRLTPVEAEIAMRLAEGSSREEIAAARSTSVETIRSHIKKIFAKLDVRREAELAARLRHLS